MQSTINNNNNTNGEAKSICIPRAFDNISEARVRKVFDKLGVFSIDHVDMIQRKNEKGEPYKRIFVHIKDWAQTADAQKAKERLLAGKELKIVYDDPWFWKASLNNWTPKPQQPQPLLNDRKPRIRLEFEDQDQDQDTKNADAATNLLSNLSLEERDRRPYSQRRVDPVYCEQDVNQGFKDRREPKKEQRKSRFSDRRDDRRDDDRRRDDRRDDDRRRDDRRDDDRRRDDRRDDDRRRDDRRDDDRRRDDRRRDGDRRRDDKFTPRSPSRSPPRTLNERKENHEFRDYRDGHASVIFTDVKPVITQPKPQKPAEQEKPVVEVKKTSEFKMNPDIRLMVATYLGIGRDEVTEEQYKNNAQFVRDLRQDDMDKQKDEDAELGKKPLDYSSLPAEPPKRKQRKILEN